MNTKILSPEEALPQIQKLLSSGISCRIVVTGTSMTPFLRNKKDSVIVRPFSGNVKKGKILLYTRTGGSCVLHRVIRTKDGIVMCGDAQVHPEPLEESRILGEVSTVFRGSKEISADSFLWMLLSRIWMAVRPARPLLLKTAVKIKQIQKRKS